MDSFMKRKSKNEKQFNLNENKEITIHNILSSINKEKPGYLKTFLRKLKEKDLIDENLKLIRDNPFAYRVELEKLLKTKKLNAKSKKIFDIFNIEVLEKDYENGKFKESAEEETNNINEFYLKVMKELINKCKDMENYQIKI